MNGQNVNTARETSTGNKKMYGQAENFCLLRRLEDEEFIFLFFTRYLDNLDYCTSQSKLSKTIFKYLFIGYKLSQKMTIFDKYCHFVTNFVIGLQRKI